MVGRSIVGRNRVTPWNILLSCCISCHRNGEEWCVMTIMLDDDDNVSCCIFCRRNSEKWCVMTIMLDDDDNVSCCMMFYILSEEG